MNAHCSKGALVGSSYGVHYLPGWNAPIDTMPVLHVWTIILPPSVQMIPCTLILDQVSGTAGPLTPFTPPFFIDTVLWPFSGAAARLAVDLPDQKTMNAIRLSAQFYPVQHTVLTLKLTHKHRLDILRHAKNKSPSLTRDIQDQWEPLIYPSGLIQKGSFIIIKFGRVL